jgi:hypothetical protein
MHRWQPYLEASAGRTKQHSFKELFLDLLAEKKRRAIRRQNATIQVMNWYLATRTHRTHTHRTHRRARQWRTEQWLTRRVQALHGRVRHAGLQGAAGA